jgi:hypothetical protein
LISLSERKTKRKTKTKRTSKTKRSMPTKRLDPSQRRFGKGSATLEDFSRSQAEITEHNRKLARQKRNKAIRKDFRRAFKKEHDLKIESFKSGERYGIACIHIKTKAETQYGGQEWIAVKDYEAMDDMAKEEVKAMAESEGAVNMFSEWVIEDALDKDRMYHDLVDDLLEDDIEEGVFETRAAAREYYREQVDDPEARQVYFPKDKWEDYLDYDELADSVVAVDGATHVLSHYDGASYETEEFDYVYWRDG